MEPDLLQLKLALNAAVGNVKLPQVKAVATSSKDLFMLAIWLMQE